LDALPPQLSGGQQQRVSLGRALIREPSVFILDEVMSHLDAHLKFRMLFDLKRLHRELGRTMIYVTHDQVEALALADRVAVMSNARLQQIGDRNTLYNAPANVFVADFIGEPPTNFLPATVTSDGLVVEGTDIRLAVSAAVAQALASRSAQQVTVGIRPQNLSIRPAPNSFSATVTINEYLGERSILTVTNGPVSLQALVPPETRSRRGDQATLSYDPANVMVFDPETEALIR
ncbi:MAG: ABC transporter ATP-binding protein, partial [Pseudomonadota bacterium]